MNNSQNTPSYNLNKKLVLQISPINEPSTSSQLSIEGRSKEQTLKIKSRKTYYQNSSNDLTMDSILTYRKNNFILQQVNLQQAKESDQIRHKLKNISQNKQQTISIKKITKGVEGNRFAIKARIGISL